MAPSSRIGASGHAGAVQREFARAIAAFTRALDPTRLVVSNDGWEHVDSDLVTVHDYTADPAVFRARYASRDAADEALATMTPSRHRILLDGAREHSSLSPIVVSEFGGISYSGADTWGYAIVHTDSQFQEAISGLLGALNNSRAVAGFCYTQLTDTLQEANGLLRADRSPKLPIETLRAIVRGEEP